MQIEIAHLERPYAALRVTDAGRIRQLVTSILEQGQMSPVLVTPRAEHRYALIDGYGRVAALERLGHDLVEAVVLDLAEPDALILGHHLQSARTPSALEEAWLLRELINAHRLALPELARRLGRSTSWISRRLALVRVLPAAVQHAVRDGRLPAHAAMRSLVPLARANAARCAELVERLGTEPVSVRELEHLAEAWRSGDAEQRRRIVEHPRLFLRAVAETVRPDPVAAIDPPRDPLVVDLEALSGIARRARRRVRERGAVLDPDQHRAFDEARLACESLVALVAAESHDARPRHSYRDPQARRAGPRPAHDLADAPSLAERGTACPA